jgi:hypothetical protein
LKGKKRVKEGKMTFKRGVVATCITVAVILLSISLVSACQSKDDAHATKAAVIKITFKDGVFNYKDQTNDVSKVVDRGAKVTWLCNVPFTIYFGRDSIIVGDTKGRPQPGYILTTVHSSKVQEKDLYKAEAYISNNCLSGHTKYTIAVWAGKKVWIDDPEIIVDPPRRRPG